MAKTHNSDTFGNVPSDNKKVITTRGNFSLRSSMMNVLSSLANGSISVSMVAQKCSIPRGNAFRSLKTLSSKGLVSKEPRSKSYSLTEAGRKYLLANVRIKVITNSSRGYPSDNKSKVPFTQGSDTIKRGHALQVKFPILGAPEGWKESPKEFFRLEKLGASDLGLKNVDGVRFTLDRIDFRVTSKSITMIPPAPFIGGAVELMRWLIPFCFEVKVLLEKRFPKLRLGDTPIVLTGEIAHEDDPVAVLSKAKGFHVIKHTDGRSRVQFDRSKGKLEIEFLHRGMFDADSDVWERRIIQLLDSPYDYDELGVKIEEAASRLDVVDKALDGLFYVSRHNLENWIAYDANIKKHVQSIVELGEGVTRLTEVIERLERFKR